MKRTWSRPASFLLLSKRCTRPGCLLSRGTLSCPALREPLRALWLRPSPVLLGGAGGKRTRRRRVSPSPPSEALDAGGAGAAAVASGQLSHPLSLVAEPAAAVVNTEDKESSSGPQKPKARRRQQRNKDGALREQNGATCATVISVDVSEVLREWRMLLQHGQVGATIASAASSTSIPTSVAAGRRTAAVEASTHPPQRREHAHHREASIAERAAAMSTILKHQEDYPQLHTIFFLDKDSDGLGVTKVDRNAVAEEFTLSLAGADTVVGSHSDLTTLLEVMRVYRQLSRQSAWMAKVLQQLGAAVLEELANAWVRAAKATATTPQERERLEEQRGALKRSVAMVLLEIRRSQFMQRQREAKAAASPSRSTTPAAKRIATGDGGWPVEKVTEFLNTTVTSIARNATASVTPAIASSSNSSIGNPLSEANLTNRVIDYVLLLLAAHVGDAAAAHTAVGLASEVRKDAKGTESTSSTLKLSAAAWRAACAKMLPSIRAALTMYSTSYPTQVSSATAAAGPDQNRAASSAAAEEDAACERCVDDLLGALLVCQQFDLVIPVSVRQVIHTDASRVLQGVCQTVPQRPRWFHFLCRQTFVSRLERLRDSPGSLYEQLCTDVFSAAASFLAVSGGPAIRSFAKAQEAAWQAAVCSSSDTGNRSLPPSPPLHSPLAEMCYALLCSGFAPEAVLGSGLCLSPSIVDLVDIVNASALFSSPFAARPLPVRAHSALTDEAVALAKRALLQSQRAVRTSTELLLSETSGPTAFATRVESGAVPEAAVSQRQRTRHPSKPKRKRGAKEQAAAAGDDGIAVTTLSDTTLLTSCAYYVCVGALVEALTRGDTASVRSILQPLFPLLELDGSAAYLVEAVELVTSRVGARLKQAGSLEVPIGRGTFQQQQPTAAAAPFGMISMAMEQGFAEFASAFQGRVSDCVLRRVLKTNTANSSSATESTARPALAAVTVVAGAEASAKPRGGSPSSLSGPSSFATAAVGSKEVNELLQLVFRFTACVLTLGMQVSFYEQLATLHASLRTARAALSEAESTSTSTSTAVTAAAVRDAFLAVKQLDALMDKLGDIRLPLPRHPHSSYARGSDLALNKIVAIHLNATANVAAALGSPDGVIGNHQNNFLLAVVHLLYRLSTNHAVEAEPVKLRAYRVDVLDPALAFILSNTAPADGVDSTATGPSNSNTQTLSVLAEVASVMCVPHTIHHVSQSLYQALTASVVRTATVQRAAAHGPPTTNPHATSSLAQQLLCAAATICLRSSPVLTACFVDMAAVLQPWLSARQTILTLNTARELQVPPSAAPILAMRRRLTEALAAASRPPTPAGNAAGVKRAQMPVHDMVAALSTLSRYDEDVACDREAGTTRHDGDRGDALPVPYGAAFMRLCRPEVLRRRGLGLRECGQLVHVAASLQQRPAALAACTEEERACVLRVPRALAVQVLQAAQQGSEHDIPAIVSGYAAVQETSLRAQVMRAFISRTIRACPELAPEEVVLCVEAYCKADIHHEYLYSVLLSRVADTTQTFPLGLSLRLLRCGVDAAAAQVRTACLTAAQPIFVAHVRHLLQSDPQQLVTVGATSTTILGCLRVCFPHDPISAAVLETIAAHHKSAGITVVKAALELTAARGSTDYTALRTLAEYCTSHLMPTSSADELADLAYLLAQCGVRSNALVTAATLRFQQVAPEAGGYALAKLASALEVACVDVDQSLVEASVQRVTELVDGYLDALENAAKGARRTGRGASTNHVEVPFTTPQAMCVLQHLRSASRAHFGLVVPAVDALLTYLGTLWATRVDAEVASSACSPEKLSLTDVETLLAACVELASEPRRHADVTRQCAEQLLRLAGLPNREGTGAAEPSELVQSSASDAGDVSRADVALLTSLTNLLVRASLTGGGGAVGGPLKASSSSPAFRAARALFDALYEKRGVLLKRHWLLDATRQALAAAGREVHPKLFGLVVEGELV